MGFRSCIPFWDREMVDFCMAIRPTDRMGRSLFYRSEMHGLLADPIREVRFGQDVAEVPEFFLKTLIKKVAPPALLSWLVRFSGRSVVVNEGLNQIYALKAGSVRALLDPVSDFPRQVLAHFRVQLKRYPSQMDFHILTSLYALRKSFRNR